MPEQDPNIREYNFAIPGNIERHIPGIPGTWPFGSRVQVNENTNQVVSVYPEGAEPMIPMPVEAEEGQIAEQAEQPNEPPALQPEQIQQPG